MSLEMEIYSKLLIITLAIPIVFLSTGVTCEPHVFLEETEMCEHVFENQTFPFKKRIWEMRKKQYTLYFSLCNDTVPICQGDTACIIQDNDSVIRLGKSIHFVKDTDLMLRSSGDTCPESPSKNYTLSIILECSFSSQPNPSKVTYDEEECNYELRMLKPGCNPKCTANIDDQFWFDLRKFPPKIDIQANESTFSLSLCQSNPDCGGTVTSCLIQNGSRIPLAFEESQSIVYDVGKDELTARGRTTGKRKKELNVLIKCNWNTDLANAVFLPQQIQGKKYHFQVESSFGCIKMPPKCEAIDRYNYFYNLTALNRPQVWIVSNTSRRITINVCGMLSQSSNICTDEYSQVCEQTPDAFLNRGSIFLPLEVNTEEDYVKANFKSGSSCKENRNFTYSTEIQFFCAKDELGPVFVAENVCVTYLRWNTPQACPVNYRKSDGCRIALASHSAFKVDLHHVYTATDKQYALSPDGLSFLEYNLCGPLHKPCRNYHNVSFCLRTQSHGDLIVGWQKETLISDQGTLEMQLEGDPCPNQRRNASVSVNFICDYSIPLPTHDIFIVDDLCRFNLTVRTKHACIASKNPLMDPFTKCSIKNGTMLYNLTGLEARNQNYIVQNRSLSDSEFILNVCGPVLSGPQAQCFGETMVCRRNTSEINIKHMFTSLGTVNGPRIVNDSLILEAMSGNWCPEFSKYYSSVIEFVCTAKEEAPRLISQTDCRFNFLWRTPQACPMNDTTCIVTNSNSQLILDFSRLPQRHFQINTTSTSYDFNLCDNSYRKYQNTSVVDGRLNRDLYETKNGIFMTYDLRIPCSTALELSKFDVEIICNQNTGFLSVAEEKSFRNCIGSLVIKTNASCDSIVRRSYTVIDPAEKTVAYELPKLPKNTGEENPNEKTTSKLQTRTTNRVKEQENIEIKCQTPEFTSGHFNLSRLDAEKILNGKNEYTINLNQRLKTCKGFLCKNQVPIESDECPKISYSPHESQLNVTYATKDCQEKYHMEIRLKCDENNSNSKYSVKEDEICKLRIEYYLPDACALLVSESKVQSATAAIVGGSLGSLLLLIFIILVIVFMKKSNPCRRSRYNSINAPKSQTLIYCKNMED